jgi:hypothetical protein
LLRVGFLEANFDGARHYLPANNDRDEPPGSNRIGELP